MDTKIIVIIVVVFIIFLSSSILGYYFFTNKSKKITTSSPTSASSSVYVPTSAPTSITTMPITTTTYVPKTIPPIKIETASDQIDIFPASFATDTDENTFWHTNGNTYNSTTGDSARNTNTKVDNIDQKGEWIQIEYNDPFILDSFTILQRKEVEYRAPKSFVMAGSNDGTTWKKLFETTDAHPYPANGKTFNISDNSIAFKFYRLIVRSIPSGTDGISVQIASLILIPK